MTLAGVELCIIDNQLDSLAISVLCVCVWGGGGGGVEGKTHMSSLDPAQ